MRAILQTIALLFFCSWWVFFLLWQPGLVHILQRVTVRDAILRSEVRKEATKRAFEYSTRGASTTTDLFFSANEMSHLQDVSSVYATSRSLLLVGVFFSLLYLFFEVSRKRFQARSFHLASRILLVVVVIAVLGFLFFSLSFPFFHQFFFPQGNWQFPKSSLLITLFPEIFWKGELLLLVGAVLIFVVLYEFIYKYWHE